MWHDIQTALMDFKPHLTESVSLSDRRCWIHMRMRMRMIRDVVAFQLPNMTHIHNQKYIHGHILRNTR